MMMNRKERLDVMTALGMELKQNDGIMSEAMSQAYFANNWFTSDNVIRAINSIADQYLNRQKLEEWSATYPCDDSKPAKKIGLVMAGNIPLVGFHDLLSVFIAGHQALIKLSSKDEILMKFVLDKLMQLDPRTGSYFVLTDRIQAPDGVIATGSNNSARYFDYYFGKYPHIIRRNRNSVAMIDGSETMDDLKALGHDLFDFFGLGCRNVSKLFVPMDYDFGMFWNALETFSGLKDHNKYMNNYDYNYAVYLLNHEKFFTNGFLILKEDASLMSRIACVHYEYYEDPDSLRRQLSEHREQIQCFVSRSGVFSGLDNEVRLGQTQQPGLFDFADGVDTMEFLTRLA